MGYEHLFSDDYRVARERFTQSAIHAGGVHRRYALENGSVVCRSDMRLSVDTASFGEGSSVIVVSSGLHGVEGYFGSAVQLALMRQWHDGNWPCRLLLIHGLNPWGFHHLRRVDENNVDLNRNYPTGDTTGAPADYHRLNGLLNPDSVAGRTDFFRAKALLNIARYGMPALKTAIASGQYAYPDGLFFGGLKTARATRLMMENLRRWIGASRRIVHFDIHTGLGRHGECKLLVPAGDSGRITSWCRTTYDEKMIEVHGNHAADVYPVNGMLGDWLLSEYSDVPYYFLGAEVGTYSPLSVLQTLREENRQHHHGDPTKSDYAKAKSALFEHFCPQSVRWRRQAVANTLQVIENAVVNWPEHLC
jgi:hypothetical protein